MITQKDNSSYITITDGIERKTLVFGDRTLMTEFRLKGGSQLPIHSHPHEQTGYLVSGKITLSIGSEKKELTPGDSWNIPSNTEHGADIHEDSIAIEVFAPVREDYLPE